MKSVLISSILLFSPVIFAQQVEIATTLSPEDFGAYKWIFSGTASKNSVVVFRVTTTREWPNEKIETDIHDTVHYTPGIKQSASAFFINPHYFNNKEEEPNWHFQVLGGSGSIAGKYAGHSYGDNKGEINFDSEKWGKTKKVFEAFIMSYDQALLLYGKLPPVSDDAFWIWSGSPKK